MNTSKQKQLKIERRHKRIRSILSGTSERPRLSVFKSHKYISAQIIDDTKGHTLATFSSINAKAKAPADKAKEVGVEIAKIAKGLKIDKVVFDRGGYLYTGKIKAVADGAREGGLDF
jgi:large subunit ribosomal protein L18